MIPLLELNREEILAAVAESPQGLVDIGYRIAMVRKLTPPGTGSTQGLRDVGIAITRISAILTALCADGDVVCFSFNELPRQWSRSQRYRRGGVYYLSRAAYDRYLALRGLEADKKHLVKCRAEAERIVLERHADEVDSVLNELRGSPRPLTSDLNLPGAGF